MSSIDGKCLWKRKRKIRYNMYDHMIWKKRKRKKEREEICAWKDVWKGM
jgi:hypothetical protein